VAEQGKSVAKNSAAEVISEQNYIFEPSTREVVDHLERSMLQIMLSEVILESKLAQYASRFKAMRMAGDKADEAYTDITRAYSRARRYLKDERLKEIVSGMRKAKI
jgi:F0F1-type ATP synthase gamma subunit